MTPQYHRFWPILICEIKSKFLMSNILTKNDFIFLFPHAMSLFFCGMFHFEFLFWRKTMYQKDWTRVKKQVTTVGAPTPHITASIVWTQFRFWYMCVIGTAFHFPLKEIEIIGSFKKMIMASRIQFWKYKYFIVHFLWILSA